MAQDSSEGLTSECGNQSDAADSRASLFNYFLVLLGGESESDSANSCNSPQKLNNYQGAGQGSAFWTKDTDNKCKAIGDNQFSVTALIEILSHATADPNNIPIEPLCDSFD